MSAACSNPRQLQHQKTVSKLNWYVKHKKPRSLQMTVAFGVKKFVMLLDKDCSVWFPRTCIVKIHFWAELTHFVWQDWDSSKHESTSCLVSFNIFSDWHEVRVSVRVTRLSALLPCFSLNILNHFRKSNEKTTTTCDEAEDACVHSINNWLHLDVKKQLARNVCLPIWTQEAINSNLKKEF